MIFTKKSNFKKQREELVERLEQMGYIDSAEVKRAMMKVKREHFMWDKFKPDSYVDTPMPIPGGVTISAPHMHAIMLSALKLVLGERILEIGFGSGILLAYMKEIVGDGGEVFGIEIVKEVFEFAKNNLKRAGYLDKVVIDLGDGSKGMPRHAPYDKIVCSASSPKIPKAWIDQIKVGGIIITPVGPVHGRQELMYARKTKEGRLETDSLGGVVFVPLVGKHGFK